MTEKQKHLLQLLSEIDAVCRKHNLRYVMAGGSLIGVVRNEGFIPWDDDVDIYMPRDDWDKLKELVKTEFPPHRALLCVDMDRTYTNTVPRYTDTRGCVLHKHQMIGDDIAGEVIDVLTLDPIPDDDKEYEKYRTHMMIYSDLVNYSPVYGVRWEIPVILYLKYLLMYQILGKEKTLKKLEDIMYSYKEEECNRYAMRWGGCPFLFAKDMMFPVKEGKFENMDVMVPQRVSDYLIWHYGDEWTYIPPHGERESHETVDIDNVGYVEFREQYMPKIDRKKVKRQSIFRKVYYMAMAKKKHRLTRECDRLRAKSVEMDLKARIAQEEVTLDQLLEEQNFSKLNEIFAEYFQAQLSARFIGREDFGNIYPFYHPTLIAVEDSAFEAAMMTLFYTERVAKAYRMIQVREKLASITSQMQQLRADIELFRESAWCYEKKEWKKAEQLTDELLGRYPNHPSFQKMKCRLLMKQWKEQGNAVQVEAFLKEMQVLYPQDGYFMKYQADLLWAAGEKEEAFSLYAKAREHTNNGIVYLEMEQLLHTQKEVALQQCRDFIEKGDYSAAKELTQLWRRLLPQDREIQGYDARVRILLCEDAEELKVLAEEWKTKLWVYQKKSPEKLLEKEEEACKMALAQAWIQLGYSPEIAKLRVEVVSVNGQQKLELLAKQCAVAENEETKAAGERYKLLGDIKNKQGYSKEAFSYYQKALACPLPDYIKEEVSTIFLKDLYTGSKKAASYAKNTDASEYLDFWLDKYGNIEEIQAFAAKLCE